MAGGYSNPQGARKVIKIVEISWNTVCLGDNFSTELHFSLFVRISVDLNATSGTTANYQETPWSGDENKTSARISAAKSLPSKALTHKIDICLHHLKDWKWTLGVLIQPSLEAFQSIFLQYCDKTREHVYYRYMLKENIKSMNAD